MCCMRDSRVYIEWISEVNDEKLKDQIVDVQNE